MKTNYEFYTGKDTYCDGETEKDVIKYLEEYGEENYQEIFKKDIRWPIFYHITPIRKNIINWYPFEKDSEILEIGAGMGAITGALCEKAKRVTSIELSKQRATAIEKRCKNKENLELIVGNFNDIKLDHKYDYVTLIGVLEYAPLYTNTENPFNDFLKQIKKLLKEDGKLLIAIENQYGIKYLSGAPEDHTGKKYDGITGYENKKGIRTFGKEELTQKLKKAGFTNTKYYYPMPDYKLPNIIYSEEYEPNEENMKKYTPYLSEENSYVEFDEKEALKDIIKNKKFDFFANSYFIEASAQEITTKVDLENQKLIPIDKAMEPFYKTHYKIGKSEDKLKAENETIEERSEKSKAENERLKEENEKLKAELNAMANSKSWKITKPIRDLRRKRK